MAWVSMHDTFFSDFHCLLFTLLCNVFLVDLISSHRIHGIRYCCIRYCCTDTVTCGEPADWLTELESSLQTICPWEKSHWALKVVTRLSKGADNTQIQLWFLPWAPDSYPTSSLTSPLGCPMGVSNLSKGYTGSCHSSASSVFSSHAKYKSLKWSDLRPQPITSLSSSLSALSTVVLVSLLFLKHGRRASL